MFGLILCVFRLVLGEVGWSVSGEGVYVDLYIRVGLVGYFSILFFIVF